jgi:signal transduction histidine kinase
MTTAIMHTEHDAENDAAVLSAIQHERLRVARNIHDVVLQDLTAVLLQLRAATRSDCRDGVFSHLGQATSAAEQGLAAARDFLRELRREIPAQPPADDTPLAPLLHEAAAHASRSGNTQVLCEFPDAVTVPRAVGDELALILREALANALKHAKARQVLCQLIRKRDAIELRVSDDGNGFLPGCCSQGFGLGGMSERAVLLGGALSIHSVPGSGTIVQMRLPAAS